MPAYVIDLAFVERMLEMAERRIAEPTSSEALYREIADELERTEGDPKMARILMGIFLAPKVALRPRTERVHDRRPETRQSSLAEQQEYGHQRDQIGETVGRQAIAQVMRSEGVAR
ncbi:hypothetical protein [Ensifer adhaerens]